MDKKFARSLEETSPLHIEAIFRLCPQLLRNPMIDYGQVSGRTCWNVHQGI